ncbi:MAG TPA: oligosaccharide flippase family protein [Rhodoblastus sp.]|nr:oligosaccharide flippase family protein [Rhodoblastus sp.]
MLIRHTLLYLPAQILGPAIQFFSILLWAYALSPADVGVVTLVIAIQEMSFALFFMWWSHYALRFISGFSGDDRRRRFLASESAAVALCCLAQAALVTPALRLIFPGAMTPATLSVTVMFMLTRSLNTYMSERARSEAHIGLYTLIQTAGPLFGVAFGFALLFTLSRSPASVFAGFAAVQSLSIAAAAFLSDFARVRPRLDREILAGAASFGFPVMAAQLLALAALNAPRFVVERFLGLAAAGNFAVGYGLGLRASSVAVMLVTAGAYPLVVRKMELEGVEAAYRQLAKNITLVALVVIPVAFGLLAVNRSVVDLLIPMAYRDATYLVLPLATIGGMMRFLRAHTTDQVFLVRSRPIPVTAIAVIDLVLGVLSAVLGLHFYGMAGAAAGPMISGFATFAASLLTARFVLDFHLPLRMLAGVTAAAALMAVVVQVAPAGPGFVGLSLRIALGAALYGGAIVALLPPARRIALTAASRLWARA